MLRMNNATAGPQGVDELDEVNTKLGALKEMGIDMGRELDVENELKNKQVDTHKNISDFHF